VDSLPLIVLLAIFVAAALAVWVAGIKLSETTDVLATRLGLGAALGGLILLAVATNLPEIAIVVTASLAGHLGIAIGNILGGIAIQTVVLVVLDVSGVKGGRPLTYVSASLVIVLEAVLVIAVLVAVVMGSRLPSGFTLGRVEPGAVLVVLVWAVGLWLLGRARSGLPWHEDGEAPANQPEPRGHSQAKTEKRASEAGVGTGRAAGVFGAAAAVTLVGGVFLAQSGEAIATHIGMSGVLFGSTVLAAATALPEVSTGLASVRMHDYQLAMSDIFGGNAFLPVLFLVGNLLSGRAVLPQARATDIYLTALGALLTGVYVFGLVFRGGRRVWRMGLDSLVVLVLYLVGIGGLVAIATH
jgi:cation:H+ antiporter